ncbi:MAG: S-layer homology domain-containing protein, partial [Oscillospiraceae bacterium]|nr:S-layer homology domain-containing protein [Oscillospiraceae bacterium]
PEPEPEPEPVPEPVWYSDVPENSWSHPYIRFVSDRGIMTGTGGGEFKPAAFATRAMIVTVLWRLENEPQSNNVLTFNDVPEGKWYTEAIRWASAKHIAGGYSSETFGPNDNVTREQLCAMLYRYAKTRDENITAAEDADLSAFTDSGEISAWAEEAIRWAVAEGIMDGVGEGRINPKGLATRAQTAALLCRLISRLETSPESE